MYDPRTGRVCPPGGDRPLPRQSPGFLGFHDVERLGLWHLDGIDAGVRSTIAETYAWRLRRYPLFDDVARHVAGAPLGEHAALASAAFVKLGQQPNILINESLVGTSADIARVLDRAVARTFGGAGPWTDDPLRALWRHEMLHDVARVLTQHTDGAVDVLRVRMAHALGVRSYEPGQHTRAVALEIAAQLGAYAAVGGRSLRRLSSDDRRDSLFHETIAEGLAAYEEWGADAPPVARAIGSVAACLRFDAPDLVERNARLYDAMVTATTQRDEDLRSAADETHARAKVPLLSTPSGADDVWGSRSTTGHYRAPPLRLHRPGESGKLTLLVATSAAQVQDAPAAVAKLAALEREIDRLRLGIDSGAETTDGVFDDPPLWIASPSDVDSLDGAVTSAPVDDGLFPGGRDAAEAGVVPDIGWHDRARGTSPASGPDVGPR